MTPIIPDQPETPVVLPSRDVVSLWERAIADTTSLSEEERLRVLGRWPVQGLDAHCHERSGAGLDALITKAAEHCEELTGDEARLITRGLGSQPGTAEDPMESLGWPAVLRQKRRDAREEVETARERQARLNAERSSRTSRDNTANARSRLSEDDRRNISFSNRKPGMPWVHQLDGEAETTDTPWGLVLYRTDFASEAEWSHFKDQLIGCTKTALTQVRCSYRRRQLWRIRFVEERSLEAASLEQLCTHFRTLRLEDEQMAGMRRDILLFADGGAIHSATEHSPLPARGWVWAADPTHAEEKLSSYQHGFTGALKVALTHVMTSFYARLTPRETLDDPAATQGLQQLWEQMAYKALYNKPALVYPPRSTMNR